MEEIYKGISNHRRIFGTRKELRSVIGIFANDLYTVALYGGPLRFM
jgi:hypothetical protein